jgi:hypothetical protein
MNKKMLLASATAGTLFLALVMLITVTVVDNAGAWGCGPNRKPPCETTTTVPTTVPETTTIPTTTVPDTTTTTSTTVPETTTTTTTTMPPEVSLNPPSIERPPADLELAG